MESLHRCEDFELALRVAKAGGHFLGIADPLVRQKMTSTNEKRPVALEACTLTVFETHRDIFQSERRYQFCREWICFKYDLISGEKMRALHHLIRATRIDPFQIVLRLKRSAPNLLSNRRLAILVRGVRT